MNQLRRFTFFFYFAFLFFEKEKTFRSHLQNARFVKGKHEYFPIPQSVIDVCGAEVMKQNPGY